MKSIGKSTHTVQHKKKGGSSGDIGRDMRISTRRGESGIERI